MTAEPSPLPPLIVEEALNQAVNGNPIGGGLLLVPLIEESRFECFALCVMLATAALTGTKPKPANGMFVLEVEDTWTGQPGRAEDLPPELAFAAEFATAWGNEDRTAAQALFDAVADEAHTEAGMERLIDGVLALYGMAIATTRALIQEQRNNPNHRED
ncbi:hypothetical protein [Streptomyces mirabilis]|uniref:hypothetical protein n=1 Tax=Streptomyces mirabilis TaxID=68239 RepID=UPI0022534C67|nr:hypothetical protein [Streptomyces mirabilis]MCX4609484.1 hypothetical protein [Streptomyces mirabilis]